MSGTGVPVASHSKRTVFAVGNTCDWGTLKNSGGVATRMLVVLVIVTFVPRCEFTAVAEHV